MNKELKKRIEKLEKAEAARDRLEKQGRCAHKDVRLVVRTNYDYLREEDEYQEYYNIEAQCLNCEKNLSLDYPVGGREAYQKDAKKIMDIVKKRSK